MAEEIKLPQIAVSPTVEPGTLIYGVTPGGLDVTHTISQLGGACAQRSQNNITFTNVNGDYFGTASSPRTGTLSFDATGAVAGGIAVVYYNNATLDMPEPLFQKGTFAPGELNKIYLERDAQGYVTANIINGATEIPATIPGAPTSLTLTEGTFTETPFAPTSLTLTEGTI